jgi:[acyl-carrier-protein] S-malonyltransferase
LIGYDAPGFSGTLAGTMEPEFKDRLFAAAFAFRGYNTTNLGKSPELLEHPAYGPTVARHLEHVSQIYADQLHRPCDLVQRVRERRESTIDTFGEDICLIVAMELAQLDILEQQFGIQYRQARVALGYSLGEMTALVRGGVYALEDVLPPLLQLSDDCAALARDVTMGIVFSRGPALNMDTVQRLCLEINQQGRGVISISSYLSPNTVLLLGQGDTIDRFRERMSGALEGPVHLRKASGLWPPLHTAIMWERNIPNRGAMLMHAMAGGFQKPVPPVLSLVTGKISYNEYNSRELMSRWLDHPQRLWDAVYDLLASGIEVVIHVGPDPNLIPATFKRLSDNVTAQVNSGTLNRLGMQAMRRIANRPWLSKVISARVALLRAPFVTHIIVEDWLLAQKQK